MFGKKNGEVKTKMLKKSYECVQCHKVICTVFIDEKDDDNFEESYPCCWPCFLKLCEEASANAKKGAKK